MGILVVNTGSTLSLTAGPNVVALEWSHGEGRKGGRVDGSEWTCMTCFDVYEVYNTGTYPI